MSYGSLSKYFLFFRLRLLFDEQEAQVLPIWPATVEGARMISNSPLS